MKLSLFIVKQRYFHVASATVAILLLVQGLSLRYNFLSQVLSERFGEHQIRLNYLQTISRSRQEELSILTKYLIGLTENIAYENSEYYCFDDKHWCFTSINKRRNNNIFNFVTHEIRTVLKISTAYFRKFPLQANLPRIKFLSQLLDGTITSLLSYVISKNRTGFTMVLGIPTVKRLKGSYLIPTLKNLSFSMNDVERKETLIVVYIGETDMNYVTSVAKEIQDEFSEHIEKGLIDIDIIAPSAHYYQNFDGMFLTCSDSFERTKWRSKHSLDVSLLMTYAQSKATYYVQLEDDIITKHGFINTMKRFSSTSIQKGPWFIIDFSGLGFIGKMFHSTDLSVLSSYFQTFFFDIPIDFLTANCYTTIFCNCTVWEPQCYGNGTNNQWLDYKPSLFQHIGKHSSLPGKIQKLKASTF